MHILQAMTSPYSHSMVSVDYSVHLYIFPVISRRGRGQVPGKGVGWGGEEGCGWLP